MDRKQYYKEYYLANKESKLRAAKERHKRINTPEFAEKRRSYFKNYYKINKKKIIARTSKNNISRIKTNTNEKIKQRLRTRIYIVLKKNKKFFKLQEVLGCSLDVLKVYLESKFTDDMSWDNYGRYGWHIDHIKPCALFDLTNPEEQKQCFHYTNLQPLWAKDNLTKHKKYNL